MKHASIEPTSALKVAMAWVVVTIPLLYGVYYSMLKAAALFR